jgi:hypothetical protein
MSDLNAIRDEIARTGHGHVVPTSTGILARCGGPGMCDRCSADKARLDRAEAEAARPYAYAIIDVTDADEPPSGREPEDRASIILDRDLERARAEARRWNAVEGDDYCGYRVYAITEVTP